MANETVFISYKAYDYNYAVYLRRILELNGITCWMAPESITPGSSYAKEIPSAIRNCTYFLVIISKATLESKFIPREFDQAIQNGKRILPFMIEPTPLNDEFNFYLSNVQINFAYNDRDAAINKLIAEIKGGASAPVHKAPARSNNNQQANNNNYRTNHNNYQPNNNNQQANNNYYANQQNQPAQQGGSDLQSLKMLSIASVIMAFVAPLLSIFAAILGMSKLKSALPAIHQMNNYQLNEEATSIKKRFNLSIIVSIAFFAVFFIIGVIAGFMEA